MTKDFTKRMQRTWQRLLKAWSRGKSKKAVRLQHRLLRLQLKKNSQDHQKERKDVLD
jgi:hypothetical protein